MVCIFAARCRWQTNCIKSSSFTLCLQWLQNEGCKNSTHKNCGGDAAPSVLLPDPHCRLCACWQLNKLQFLKEKQVYLSVRYFFTSGTYIAWKFGIIMCAVLTVDYKGALPSVQKSCLQCEETVCSLRIKSTTRVPSGNRAFLNKNPINQHYSGVNMLTFTSLSFSLLVWLWGRWRVNSVG